MPKPPFKSWREVMQAEVPLTDPARVHFVGSQPYAAFLDLLQVSSVHLYLTYPFVLSWSCVEALSAGCLVIGSDTPPVAEFIDHGRQFIDVLVFQFRQLAIGAANHAFMRDEEVFQLLRLAMAVDRRDRGQRCGRAARVLHLVSDCEHETVINGDGAGEGHALGVSPTKRDRLF